MVINKELKRKREFDGEKTITRQYYVKLLKVRETGEEANDVYVSNAHIMDGLLIAINIRQIFNTCKSQVRVLLSISTGILVLRYWSCNQNSKSW